MHYNVARGSKFSRVLNSVAAGTTNQNSSVVDTEGFPVTTFIVAVGALTATQVTGAKIQHGDQSDGSDMADVTGGAVAALADADSNKTVVLEIVRPRKRYVRVVVTRGTANAVIDGVFCFQSHAAKAPVTSEGSTVKEKLIVVSPA